LFSKLNRANPVGPDQASMAFVNGGLGTGFGGLDQELLEEGITPRA